jgi:NAD(P)-dependent dehydrogenase (short-subunit alcohol dehydrogenase family)
MIMSDANKTVLVTGASSGIGLETAVYFFEQGWTVIATMRDPDKRRTPLHEKGQIDLVHLDVTDSASIRTAVQHVVDTHQRLDVLVNNAGYAVYGPFEATTPAQMMRQFNTNVFGLLEVTRACLPLFRQQKEGVVVNVASMGGRIGFPLYTLYNSTKWAVEGFSEALRYELKPLNIRVKLIEPGVIKTDFYDRSLETVDSTSLMEAYGEILKRGQKRAGENALRTGITPRAVAQTIYRAATDASGRMRYPVGRDAWQVAILRRLLPDELFFWLLEKAVLD